MSYTFKTVITFLALFSSLAQSISAQNGFCLDFENLPTTYYDAANHPAGDTLFEIEGIPAVIDSFDYGNNSGGISGVEVLDINNSSPLVNGHALRINNTILDFDFSHLADPVVAVSFNYWDRGSQLNMGVNRQPISIANSFAEMPSWIAPGIKMQVYPYNNASFEGTILLNGEISSLQIGGQEFYFDNLCLTLSSGCEIPFLDVQPLPCTPNGVFFAELNAAFSNVSDSFQLKGNGNDYGTFAYADIPFTFGPLEGNGTINEFVIIDSDDPSCTDFVELDAPVSCANCNIEVTDYQVVECTNGEFYLFIEFLYINPLSEIHIFVNGEIEMGNIATSGSVTLGPYPANGQTEYLVELVDAEFPDDCMDSFALEPVLCSNTCEIYNVVAEASDCDNNEQFFVNLDFDYQNVGSGGFMVIGDGTFYGTFEYAALPIRLGPFTASGQTLEFNVFDMQDPNCIGFTEIGPMECQQPCQIGDIFLHNLGCDGDDFWIEIEFEHQHTSDSFFIKGNGINYGTFAYSDQPIHLGLPGDGQTVYELVIVDSENQDCRSYTLVDAMDCTNSGPCEFGPMHITFIGCEQNLAFYAINFEYANVPSDSFTLKNTTSNGVTTIAYYAYADLPIVVLSDTSQANQVVTLKACDSQNSDCNTQASFITQDCRNNPNCGPLVWDIRADVLECVSNTSYKIKLDFEYFYPGTQQFEVHSQGILLGTFQYQDLPINLTIPASGNSLDIIDICVPNQPNCCVGIEVEAPDCNNGGACEIFDLQVDVGECTSTETYSVTINFGYSNPGNDFFEVFALNQNLGFFPLSSLPLTIDDFPASGNPHDALSVCINDQPNCCKTIDFQAPDCNNTGNCKIFEVIAEAHDCDPAGQFLVDINFEYLNTSDSFIVQGNGIHYGTFAYSDLWITLGPFIGDGQTVYEFVIIDQENPNCQNHTVIGPIDCNNGGACEIFDLQVDVGECTSTETYSVTINFGYSNPGNDFFEVFALNQNLGFFPLSSLPLTIDDFPASGNPHDALSVCINDQPNCCKTIDFQAPDCNNTGNCKIFEVIAEAHDCDPAGQFLVDINFEYLNTSDSFIVQGNGIHYGTFAYSDLWITLGPFIGDGQTVYEFVIIDQENPNCQNHTVIGPIDCNNGGACEIFDLQVDVGECTSSETYSVTINFEYVNPGNDFFEVFALNQNLGFFPLSSLPLTIDDFPASGNPHDALSVCINDQPNCCKTVDFEAPSCNDECRIFDLEAHPIDCNDDGTYSLFVNFNVENATTDGFFIYSGGQFLGEWNFSDLPLFISNFSGGGGPVDEITVQTNDNDNCRAAIEFEALNCQGCEIYDLIVEPHNCQGHQFYVDLDFEYQNVGVIGFQVLGNGENYGNFDYEDLPITLGPFDSNNSSMLEFTVFDLVNFNCTDNVEIETPDCNGLIFNCLTYVGLEDSLGYGIPQYLPGDELFVERGVTVYMKEMIKLNGGSDFNTLFVGNDEIPGLNQQFNLSEGAYLQFVFANLLFDFTHIPGEVVSVEFDFDMALQNALQTVVNIAVNGQPLQAYGSIFDIPTDIAPGIEFQIVTSSNDPHEGRVTISGPVKTLLFGGNGFAIDNICYDFQGNLNEVWPGDTNFDNIANAYDLLNIGLAFGKQGPNRPQAGVLWDAFLADNWPELFHKSAVNHKHADCNGDGVIDVMDREAININYNRVHGPVQPVASLQGIETDPHMYVDLPDGGSLATGQSFNVPVILGSPNNEVESIYGLAFKIKFDPDMINPASVELEIGDSWLGTMDEDLISLDKTFAEDGIIEVAISRTDHQNTAGHGPVLSFIGIIDNVGGKSDLTMDLAEVQAIQYDERRVPIYTKRSTTELSTDTDNPLEEGMLQVFPNPANHELFIRNRGTEVISAIHIYNTIGQRMISVDQPALRETVDVSSWASGIYFVEIRMGVRTYHRKFEVIR